jgi:hypothetical protein
MGLGDVPIHTSKFYVIMYDEASAKDAHGVSGVVVDSSQNIPFMLHVYYVNILKGTGNETEYNAQS